MRRIVATLFAAFLFTIIAGVASAAERILEFDSRIRVHTDGAMTVTETIKVVSTGNQIKRGIFRAFPTDYEDRFGNTVRVGFDVVEVLRDGRPEPYFTKPASNGTRVYIGREDVFLRPGTYTYTITYTTDRQLGFFEDFDELYWNVTGNGWAFPIERATATVELPSGTPIHELFAYTGPTGSTARNFTSTSDAAGNARFVTTRALGPREGLTIVVSWPKGVIAAPTASDRLDHFADDNASVIAGLVGLALILVYYLFAWAKVGRNPAKGAIVPLFSPPKDFSPAAVRFVMRMKYDHKAFAAAVVSMAVKGYLTIRETVGGSYALEKTGAGETALSSGEKQLARNVFGTARKVDLEVKNHERIGKALRALRDSLRTDFEKIHFLRNSIYLIPGVILTVLCIGALAFNARRPDEAAFMVVWLTMWTAGCGFLAVRVVHAWRSGKVFMSIFVTLFATPFFIGEAFGLTMMGESASPLAVALFLLMVLVNVLFYELLRAPTTKGRRVMDHIEGFKMYMTTAEKERLELLNPPDKTPELFEKYLPFALALDVEHEWSEQFNDVLAAAGHGNSYSPRWYSGGHWAGDGVAGLADSLGGSFAGAISSSSTAPGSSSGGGGGSSGGGGGGGGGGGW